MPTETPTKDLAAIAAELWTRLEGVELRGGWPDDRANHRAMAQAQIVTHIATRLTSEARALGASLRGKDPPAGVHPIDAAAAAINEHLHELLMIVVDGGPEARACQVITHYRDGYWFPRSTTP